MRKSATFAPISDCVSSACSATSGLVMRLPSPIENVSRCRNAASSWMGTTKIAVMRNVGRAVAESSRNIPSSTSPSARGRSGTAPAPRPIVRGIARTGGPYAAAAR